MTEQQLAATKQALEAICGSGDFLFNWHDCEPNNEREMQEYQAALAANEKAFIALRTAIEAETAQGQEHNLKDVRCECCGYMTHHREHMSCIRAASTTPPAQEFVCSTGLCHYKAQREWVGLTDEEYKQLHLQMGSVYLYQDYGRAIEAKLKEKNT